MVGLAVGGFFWCTACARGMRACVSVIPSALLFRSASQITPACIKSSIFVLFQDMMMMMMLQQQIFVQHELKNTVIRSYKLTDVCSMFAAVSVSSRRGTCAASSLGAATCILTGPIAILAQHLAPKVGILNVRKRAQKDVIQSKLKESAAHEGRGWVGGGRFPPSRTFT